MSGPKRPDRQPRVLTIYGIKSCDTCRRAVAFFDEKGLEYRFHDLRDDGLGRPMLDRWDQRAGWEMLLNRRSLTWRQLEPAERDNPTRDRAIGLMLEHPTLVKRPVIEADDFIAVGFSEKRLADYLARRAPD